MQPVEECIVGWGGLTVSVCQKVWIWGWLSGEIWGWLGEIGGGRRLGGFGDSVRLASFEVNYLFCGAYHGRRVKEQ